MATCQTKCILGMNVDNVIGIIRKEWSSCNEKRTMTLEIVPGRNPDIMNSTGCWRSSKRLDFILAQY